MKKLSAAVAIAVTLSLSAAAAYAVPGPGPCETASVQSERSSNDMRYRALLLLARLFGCRDCCTD